MNYIAGIEKFKKYNRIKMSKEVRKYFLEILQVVEISKEWCLIIGTDIKNMLKMVQIYDIHVYVFNKMLIK